MATHSTEQEVLRLSDLAPGNLQSEIRSMSLACAAANGINLAQGVCDTPVPETVVNAANDAMRNGDNTYTRLDGIAPLREAIALKLCSFNGIQADPETQILVTSGATGALHAALMALLNPGDACIILEPFYGYHLSTLRSLRIEPIVVPLSEPKWQLDAERLRSAITPRTRALIVNTPSNPTGRVFSDRELSQIADIAVEHNLFVFTDEMYEHFVYDEAAHVSLATLPGMGERTITISGFSKVFSVTGWRLGYLTADARWIPPIGYFHDLTYVCAPAPLQHGVTAGLRCLPDAFYHQLTSDYQAKRDGLCRALADAGLTPSIPQGAYYVLADVSHIPGENAKEKALTLLSRTGVAAVAGSAFFLTGTDGKNRGGQYLRFCFAKRPDELAEACERLRSLRSLMS